MRKKEVNVVGLMSGTSLDGLDICWVRFFDSYNFEIVKTKAVGYSSEFRARLASAHTLSGLDLMKLSNDFSLLCAKEVIVFLKEDKSQIDLIASHGHTVFHNPEEKLTTQIGSGAVLYAETGIKTISDFRSVDVALGGQGAPLVPIGDLLLFKDYQSCLNLGGIANISVKVGNSIKAQDLCFANMLSNYICEKKFNVSYDKSGLIGKQGAVDETVLRYMMGFHQSNKSLAREDYNSFLDGISKDILPIDLLRTAYEYTASFIAEYVNKHNIKEVLVTGGGSHNDFFISLLERKVEGKITVPSSEIIDFKEALIFAFLGLLRIEGKDNVLRNVTLSTNDNLGGAIYG